MTVKLIFLGSGSAFTVGAQNYQSNLLLVSNGKHLLIDCGTDVRHALWDLDFSFKDIDAVYVSHVHSDHIGGLEWLGLTRKFDGHCRQPQLFAHKQIIRDLWDFCLSKGMQILPDRIAQFHDFFSLHPPDAQLMFEWENISFQLVQTDHMHNDAMDMPCYGLFFEINGKRILFTADTQFAPHLFAKYFEMADIIFHDCEIAGIPSGVHARFEQLAQELPRSIREKMWLYHYGPGQLPDAKQYGFCGFVKRGQIFEF